MKGMIFIKDKLLKILENIHEAKSLIEINDLLNLKTVDELKELQNILKELVDDYTIYYTKKEKYILLKNCPSLKIGKISINKKGFGFLILPNEEDLYIDDDNLGDAIDDDIVLCEKFKRGLKEEARVLKVVKRELKNLVGEVYYENDIPYLKLDDNKKDIKVKLDKESASQCVAGHKVLVSVEKEIKNHLYLGRVLKIIGHKDDPGVDILSIAYKYSIYSDFPEAVLNELKDLPITISKEELVNRRDLTDKIIFTIDDDSTKDIDDAISLEMDNDNYVLGVHIADVSHYVKENTALGDEAFLRGTSSYLADTVIPMLPHQLSNGICSLNENVIRLTFSCEMVYDSNGKLLDYDIFPSFIKSSKKMTYKKVNDILMRDIVDPEYAKYKDILLKMNELAHILRKYKEKRGYIDFNLDEAKIIQDSSGKAIDIQKRIREDGEKLIEDFMIAANECVATHIYNMDLPFIYRVHETPKPEKIEEFLTMIKLLGYKTRINLKNITPHTMQNLLAELAGVKEFKTLSSMLLRSMRKAVYSKDNIGHFGIASSAYTHFTSPIRRFPDLEVHRLLKKYLVDQDFSMTTIDNLNTSLDEIADHSSEREVAAQNAERDVDDMKMAEYMESHVGEEYIGKISSVTNFGFFVQLENLIEGLVHVSTLKGDYYNYVPELLSIVGKSTKKVYRLGDEIKVKCVAASKYTSLIDFEVIEDNGNNKSQSKV